MLRNSLHLAAKRGARVSLSLGFFSLAALLATSCLTPDFNFDPPADRVSAGGAGNGDGDGDGDGDGGLSDHCENRTTDADESDTDCGGRDCDPCSLGRSCKADPDCENGTCTDEKCQDPTCTDEYKNSSETDVDCGGPGCAPCGEGLKCQGAEDCASSVCGSGACAAPSCSDRVQNGNESDIDCGGDCDPCDSGSACVVTADCLQPPEDDPSSSVCDDGICTLLCASGLGDCNQKVSDGCETTITTSLDHCGVCGSTCSPANTSAAKCVAGECLIDFEAGGCRTNFEDCNGEPEDGCEANLTTDAGNCNGCNNVCSSANGTASCSGGECEIECDGAFSDCDDDPASNGCEADTSASIENCGTCGNVCVAVSGESASCDTTNSGDPCQSVACNGPSDCGGEQPCGACDSSTCDDRLDNIENCNGCGLKCEASNATTSCADAGGGSFECRVATCVDVDDKDFEDCDGDFDNGCEANVNRDTTHCGACSNGGGGDNCTAYKALGSVAEVVCSAGSCEISACTGTNVDCDGDPTNGCEVDTATDDARCGGCLPTDPNPGGGANCNNEWAHASGSCEASSCNFEKCDNNWGDCNSNLADGCETDLRVTREHCGTCGAECVVETGNSVTTANSCSSSQCSATCGSNGAKCDSNEWNGCERIDNDPDNCGTCGNTCGGNGASVDSATCSGRSCTVSCTDDLCSDGTAAASCTVSLGTIDDCSFCGETCSDPNNICTVNGCDDHLPLVITGSKNFTSGAPSGSTSYTLTSTTNTNRGLILAVAATRGAGYSTSAKITWGASDEQAMQVAHRQQNQTIESTIYYLQEDEMPDAGTTISFVVTSADTWGGLVATAIEVQDMYQKDSPVFDAGGTFDTADCPNTITRSAPVTHDDSLIIAVADARENSGNGGSAQNLTLLHSGSAGNQTEGFIGYFDTATSAETVGFNITRCWDSNLTTATFRPYSP